MAADYGRPGAEIAAAQRRASAQPRRATRVPAGQPAGTGALAPAQRPDTRVVAAVRRLALPATDAAALAVAVAVTGPAGRAGAGLVCACYGLAVLGILAASRQYRLRICLRSSDQADRILIAATVPLPALLGWWPAGQLAWLAVCSAGFMFIGRTALYAALRAAHRRDRLTEPALIVGSGTFGAYVADLLRAHPELGLRPRGFLDDGPPRRDLSLPSLGTPADLAGVVAELGIRRVIVCFSTCRDEDFVAVIRASRPLRADICVVPRLYELGAAVPRGCLDEIWGIPLVPLRSSGRSLADRALKRAADLAAALVLLAAAAPVLLAMAAVTRLGSGQPAFSARPGSPARAASPGC